MNNHPKTVPSKSAKRIAGVIFAAFVIGAALIFAGLMQGCPLQTTPLPPAPKTIAAPSGPEAAKLGAAVAEIPAAVAEAQEKQRKAVSKAVAEFDAITEAAGAITEPEDANAATAIKASADQGKKELGVEADPADRLAALERTHANLKGDFERAKQLYRDAATAADKAKAERDAAIKARDEAVAAAQKQAAAAAEESRRLAGENQKRFNDLEKMITNANTVAERARDEARKEADSLLFKCLLGLGGLLILIAVGIAVLTQGTQLLRSAICAGGGAFCFAVAWTLNQPWFPWIFWGGLSLGGIAVGVYLWTEFRSTKDVKTKAASLDELERVRSAGEKVVAQLDDWRSEVGDAVAKPLIEKLGRVMNDQEKIAIHDLRRQAAVRKKSAKSD
jgi:hypothetical protein